MAMTPLSPDAVRQALEHVPQWTLSADGRAIEREFVFDDFAQAFGFMARLALVSEAMNHHPEWFNVWNRVSVTMSTHDAGGLTERDFRWAQAADAACARP